jgi:ABC-type transport system involved in multi-copper enzyme maturation permease subunit
MNPLVKKEIRLLLPSFLIGVALTFANCFYTEDELGFNALASVVAIVACSGIAVFTALNSFGAEISAGTFSLLLAQPVSRHRIWRTKAWLLAAALFIGGITWCAILYLRFEVFHHQKVLGLFSDILIGTWLFLLVIYSGALWTVLLLRQVAAAFWFTLLTPGVVLGLIVGLWPDKYSTASEPAVIVGLVTYSLTGLWFARRLFLRAEDVAWTGGIISVPGGRFFAASSDALNSTRKQKPFFALLKKEFQLHSISLFCVGVLLALHIGVFFLRIFYTNSHKNSLAVGVSDYFWALWLVMPLVIGCTAAAEERKLGVAESQLCLPVSRRFQFSIKFIPAMIFSTLLGGVMPMLLETAAAHFGAPNEFFKLENYASNDFFPTFVWFKISIVALSAGMSAAAFFASTLARSFLQALGLAIVIATGCGLAASFIATLWARQVSFLGIIPVPLSLRILIAIPTMAVLYLWLACRNFSHFQEGGRLWRRNVFGIMGALVFIFVSSTVIYNRPWEIFEPAEPAHGPAIFSPANPPKLNSDVVSLLVRLPDGRVWFDSLKLSSFAAQRGLLKNIWYLLIHPWLAESAGPRQFIAGSNWVSATALRIDWPESGYLDTVGVKSNGTLWISSESKPKVWTGDEMMQFGSETNWQQAIPLLGERLGSFLLLKNDGTLWCWGTNCFDRNSWQTNWPTVRALNPRQVGTNSDWKEIFCDARHVFARKADGSVWALAVDSKTGKDKFLRQTDLDQVVFQTFSDMNDARMAYIGEDGTLWVCNRHSDEHNSWKGFGYLQVGKETNWLAMAVTWTSMVALKSDGSLWKWNFPRDSTAEVAKIPPTRLGVHSDWVAITGALGGAVSLAADGSLWLWPCANYEAALLKAPMQPEFLGNVFGKAD